MGVDASVLLPQRVATPGLPCAGSNSSATGHGWAQQPRWRRLASGTAWGRQRLRGAAKAGPSPLLRGRRKKSGEWRGRLGLKREKEKCCFNKDDFAFLHPNLLCYYIRLTFLKLNVFAYQLPSPANLPALSHPAKVFLLSSPLVLPRRGEHAHRQVRVCLLAQVQPAQLPSPQFRIILHCHAADLCTCSTGKNLK